MEENGGGACKQSTRWTLKIIRLGLVRTRLGIARGVESPQSLGGVRPK